MKKRIGSAVEPFIVGQDESRRAEIEAQLFKDFEPKDVLEEIWLSDIAVLTTTIEYYRELEAAVTLKLSQTLQIAMLGADYMTTDISGSPRDNKGGFVEINTCPGLDAMIAAGWPTEKAGDLALSSDIGAISKTLIIVPADRFERTLSAANGAHWPVGTGWASREEAMVSGAALHVPDGDGWTGMAMLLGHRAVTRAILFASDLEILRLGMPVSKVDQLVLAAHLPFVWEQVLRSKSTVAETGACIADTEGLIERLMA